MSFFTLMFISFNEWNVKKEANFAVCSSVVDLSQEASESCLPLLQGFNSVFVLHLLCSVVLRCNFPWLSCFVSLLFGYLSLEYFHLGFYFRISHPVFYSPELSFCAADVHWKRCRKNVNFKIKADQSEEKLQKLNVKPLQFNLQSLW